MALILLADDGLQVHLAVKSTLSAKGRDFIGASDGKEAPSISKKTEFELLTHDYMIPGMSGIEVCNYAKAKSADQLPPSLCYGSKRHPNGSGFFQMGTKKLFLKPFRIPILIERTEATLNSLGENP